jgi:hypothetical protein
MSPIAPNETTIEGARAAALVQSELVKLASRVDLWTQLFRDPSDGRLWELSYPQSEMHGGGPPRFISPQEALSSFGYSGSV